MLLSAVFWAAPNALASTAYTELSYAGGELSGYSRTYLDYYEYTWSECVGQWYWDSSNSGWYCTVTRKYVPWVGQTGALYTPSDEEFYSDYEWNYSDSRVTYDVNSPGESGLWGAYGTHYSGEEVWMQECTGAGPSDCFWDLVSVTGDEEPFDYTDDDAVAPATNITWISWNPTEFTAPGCTAVEFDEDIDFADVVWHHLDDDVTDTAYNFPNGGESCVGVEASGSFGTYEILSAMAVGASASFVPSPFPTVVIQAPTIQVTVNTADVVQDKINVTLGPAGLTGQVTVLLGSHQVLQGTLSSGNPEFSFSPQSIPIGTYTTVTVTWVTGSGSGQGQKSVNFEVLGHDWRQSRYNIPGETNCSGGTSTGYFYTYSGGQCSQPTGVSLKTNFMARVGAYGSGTGTGTSINHGMIRSEFVYGQCLVHGATPGELDFRQDSLNTACQGTQSNYASDSTIAVRNGMIHSPSARAGCGAQYLVVNPAWGTEVKTVTDFCPHCGGFTHAITASVGHQFDNFTTSQACTSGLGQQDDTTVIKLN